MIFTIKHQERLSRGELLLRTIFGWIYIYIPHYFVLFFVSIWGAILSLVAWWVILFTGRYPQSFFEFQVGLIAWQARLFARHYNLSDGYPAFGVSSSDEAVTVDIPYPDHTSRGLLLVRTFFGFFYVLIPHGFCLFFLGIGVMVAAFIGWCAVLFNAQMPLSIQNFVVGFYRWTTRVSIYMKMMTDTYPPFSLD